MKHIINRVRHMIDLVHDGRRRQRTVRYQTSSPRPKFRVVQDLKFTVARTGKFKRMLSLLLVDKGKLCGAKLSVEEFNLVFFPAWLVLKICNQGSKVYEEFSGTSRTLQS